MSSDLPSALILGGCGFVGRNLVWTLVNRRLCSRIRVVDKTLPALAFLAGPHEDAFKDEVVEFKQADLSRQAGVEKAFDGEPFDFVFNVTYDGVPFGQVLHTTTSPMGACSLIFWLIDLRRGTRSISSEL